jgi:PAS domain S-box-containing protein
MAKEHTVSHDTRILLLVHDPTDAEVIEMQLRKAHLRCTIQRVSAKDQFMTAVRSVPPDCVIADTSIPRLDVMGVMANVRNEHPEIVWVLLTPAGSEETLVGWMKAGASDVVTRKSITRIGSAVADVLARAAARTFPGPSVPPPPPPPVPVSAPAPAPTLAPAMTPSQQAELHMLRDVLEHAEDLVALLDARGTRLYSNAAHKDVIDSPEHLRGTVMFVDVHPEDRPRVTTAFLAGLREGKEVRCEYRVMDNRGMVRIYESIASPVRTGPLDGPRSVVVSRDVTDRTQRERDKETLVRVLEGLSGELYFIGLVNALARILHVRYVLVSEAVYQPAERVRSLAYYANGSLLPSFEYDLTDTTCAAVFENREPVHYPDRIAELFPRMEALVTMGARSYLGVPLLNSAGLPVGHVFIMDDKRFADAARAIELLTGIAPRTAMEVERHRQDIAVHASEARLRSILESLAAGVLVVDPLNIITYLNGPAAGMAERTGVEVIGKPLTDLLEFDDATSAGRVSGEDVPGRLIVRGSERKNVSVRARALKDANGRANGTIYVLHLAAGNGKRHS